MQVGNLCTGAEPRYDSRHLAVELILAAFGVLQASEHMQASRPRSCFPQDNPLTDKIA